jgi:hypothetical protein
MIIPDHPDDLLLDEKFTPCRDERCSNLQLHAEHRVPVKRGRQLRRCPICNAAVTRIPRKRVFCSKCSWRIVNNPTEEIESARDQS